MKHFYLITIQEKCKLQIDKWSIVTKTTDNSYTKGLKQIKNANVHLALAIPLRMKNMYTFHFTNRTTNMPYT